MNIQYIFRIDSTGDYWSYFLKINQQLIVKNIQVLVR